MANACFWQNCKRFILIFLCPQTDAFRISESIGNCIGVGTALSAVAFAPVPLCSAALSRFTNARLEESEKVIHHVFAKWKYSVFFLISPISERMSRRLCAFWRWFLSFRIAAKLPSNCFYVRVLWFPCCAPALSIPNCFIWCLLQVHFNYTHSSHNITHFSKLGFLAALRRFLSTTG